MYGSSAWGNKGVKSDISCACHWTVNQAASEKIGKMWGKSYVFTPGGIMVPPESPITQPEQLAGQEIAVGYHSGSHYTTIQSLEPFMAREQIKLRFGGSIWARVDIGVGRDLPAVSVWGLSYQVLEQLGFRKVVDASFMIAFMFPAGVDPADVEKYMNGMKRAQMELDFAPEKYRHYYLNEIPERYKSKVDTRRFSTGERIVFLPYTEEVYAKTQAWIHERGIFEGEPPAADYAASVAA
jgi:NitT/TauT family transport system substrate-binding protein